MNATAQKSYACKACHVPAPGWFAQCPACGKWSTVVVTADAIELAAPATPRFKPILTGEAASDARIGATLAGGDVYRTQRAPRLVMAEREPVVIVPRPPPPEPVQITKIAMGPRAPRILTNIPAARSRARRGPCDRRIPAADRVARRGQIDLADPGARKRGHARALRDRRGARGSGGGTSRAGRCWLRSDRDRRGKRTSTDRGDRRARPAGDRGYRFDPTDADRVGDLGRSAQIRACSEKLLAIAKGEHKIVVIAICQINKDNTAAGPRRSNTSWT